MIDADLFIDMVNEKAIDLDDVFRKAPTVDPATPHWECVGKVKKVELEEPTFIARCSYCKSTFRITRRYYYCPRCGADMRESNGSN